MKRLLSSKQLEQLSSKQESVSRSTGSRTGRKKGRSRQSSKEEKLRQRLVAGGTKGVYRLVIPLVQVAKT